MPPLGILPLECWNNADVECPKKHLVSINFVLSPCMTAQALVSTPHMAPRCTPLCWLLCSPKVVYQFKWLASCLTCLGTRLQLTLGTVWHFLRGTFEHSCTSMSAHLSLGTSSHFCRGTSLQSSLEWGWGKMALIIVTLEPADKPLLEPSYTAASPLAHTLL